MNILNSKFKSELVQLKGCNFTPVDVEQILLFQHEKMLCYINMLHLMFSQQ